MANETVREKIIEALVARLKTIEPDPTDPDGFSFAFADVKRGSLPAQDHTKRYMAGVVPGRETKKDLYPFIHCSLPVDIEFRITIQSKDKSSSHEAERLLGEVQRCIYFDKELGGLCLDIRETGNEIDMNTYSDKTVLGVLSIEIPYRHAHDDPRRSE